MANPIFGSIIQLFPHLVVELSISGVVIHIMIIESFAQKTFPIVESHLVFPPPSEIFLPEQIGSFVQMSEIPGQGLGGLIEGVDEGRLRENRRQILTAEHDRNGPADRPQHAEHPIRLEVLAQVALEDQNKAAGGKIDKESERNPALLFSDLFITCCVSAGQCSFIVVLVVVGVTKLKNDLFEPIEAGNY